MQTFYVTMDETDHSLRGLALGQNLAAQLGASLAVVSVVADPAQAEGRREALRARLGEEQKPALDAIPVEVLVDDSAKAALARLAGQEDVGLCMGALQMPSSATWPTVATSCWP